MLAYLRVQLLHKIRGLDPRNHNEGKKQSKGVWAFIGIGVLMLYLYGILVFMEYMLFDTLTKTPIISAMQPEYILLMAAFLASTFITLIYGFFSVNSTLFFSQDISSIAAMPISGRSVLTVRMASTWAGDALLTLLVVLPLSIMISLKSGFDALLLLKVLIISLCVPMIPLAIDMVLSFLLIRVSALWKRREGMTVVATFVLMFAVIFFNLKITEFSDEEISQMLIKLLVGEQSILNLILRNYPPLQWAADGLMQSGLAGWASVGLFAAVSVGVIALVIWLFGKDYLNLAVKQSEIRTVMDKGERKLRGSGDVRSPRKSLFMQELRELFTVPAYASNGLAGMIMIPLMIGAMAFALSSDGMLGEALEGLQSILTGEIVYAIMLGLGMFGSSVSVASTGVSREGITHEQRKTFPVTGLDHLLPKLWIGMLMNGFSILLLAVVACVILPKFIPWIVMGFLASQLASFILNAIGLCYDAAHPKLNWRTEQEAMKSNFNSMIVFLGSLAMLGIGVGVVFLVIWLGGTFLHGLLALTALLIIGALACWRLLTRTGVKSYYLH